MADGKAGAPKGNKNAVKGRRMITSMLQKVVTQSPDKIRKACEKLLDDAAEGNIYAFREIFDRLDGKPVQAVEIDTSKDENEVPASDIEIARKLAFALNNAVKSKAEEVASQDEANKLH